LENGEDNEWIKHIKDKHLLNHINGMSKYRKMQNTKYTKRNENILKVWSGGVTLALIGCFAGYYPMVNDIGDGYFGGGFIGAVAAVLFCFVVYIIILVIMSRYYADINLYLEKEELRGLAFDLIKYYSITITIIVFILPT
jgi:hypothetical protein